MTKQPKQIVELINPSDAVTFLMDDVAVAGVAITILGRGAYALENEQGETVVPLMLFGIDKKWFANHGVDSLDDYIDAHTVEMAEFLETCCYGNITERVGFDEAIKRMTPERAKEYQEWWNDKQRSSMNDIGKGALQLAKRFRAMAAGKKSDEPLPKAVPIILAS